MEPSALTLVDWRHQVSDLYAAVRADVDPEAGHARWRAGRDRLFREHPQSPLAADDPLRTTGLPYWPYDPALRLEAEPDVTGPPEERVVEVGDDGAVTMRRLGQVGLPEPVGGRVDVWWLQQYGGGLFLPLRDATSGTGSYGGGRYLLDTAKGAWLGSDGERLVLDLNFLYHPSCRYNPRWVCPLAAPGNTVAAPIEAGERLARR